MSVLTIIHLENTNLSIYVTHSLTAPSGAANRSIGSSQAYKAAKLENPKYTTFDFRVEQYGRVFLNVPEKTKSS